MQRNQRCLVCKGAGNFSNRVGYFQFYGSEGSQEFMVLSDNPIANLKAPQEISTRLFVVVTENVEVVMTQAGAVVVA